MYDCTESLPFALSLFVLVITLGTGAGASMVASVSVSSPDGSPLVSGVEFNFVDCSHILGATVFDL